MEDDIQVMGQDGHTIQARKGVVIRSPDGTPGNTRILVHCDGQLRDITHVVSSYAVTADGRHMARVVLGLKPDITDVETEAILTAIADDD